VQAVYNKLKDQISLNLGNGMVEYRVIKKYLQEKLPNYFDIHRQMVEINSFTANPGGINILGEATAHLFEGLGFQTQHIPSVDQRYGKHLFLHKPGRAQKPVSVALVSHLDTVFPPEEEAANDFTWRLEGDRIYGPGTVDIKGGTVVIFMLLDALQKFAADVYESINVWVCLNATEEVLSDEFANLCMQRLPVDTRACLVFEGGTPSGDDYSLVVARKGRATYQVSVEGRSAHSGNYHHLGANALVQMAHTVQKIAGLTDYKNLITFNVGTLSGGVVVNRVPHHAEAEVEMRAFSPEVFEQGVADMLALDGSSDVSSQDGYPCKVRVKLMEHTAPWGRNPATEELFSIWEKAAAGLGIHIIQEERGGLSDANLLWQSFPVLDGLGPVGANAHCSERSLDGSKEPEYSLASSFVPKTLLSFAGMLHLIHDSESAEKS
jgi:glutamate carboxypeptidase